MQSKMTTRFIKRRRTTNLLGWPTDIVSVDPKLDHPRDISVHTILVWVPGNPGQHDWYHFDFVDVLIGLGRGYAIRSLSHAGHGLVRNSSCGDDYANSIIDVEDHCHQYRVDKDNSASPLIPWTVEGQVLHKIAFVDSLLSSIAGGNRTSEYKHQDVCPIAPNPRFIFIGHSFGCHVIQRMCILRPDILERTTGFLFLMPYIRSKPCFVAERKIMDFVGSYPEYLISIGTKLSRILKFFPEPMVRSLIRKGLQGDSSGNEDGGGDGESTTNVATKLLRDPLYPRTFFELGTEEIRDIPNEIDITALRLLSLRKPLLFQSTTFKGVRAQLNETRHRPIFILYADDNDQWCPSFHGEEIRTLQSVNVLPESIERTKISCLRHDYVCQNQSVRSKVNNWCISKIIRMNNNVRGIHVKKPSRMTEILSSKL